MLNRSVLVLVLSFISADLLAQNTSVSKSDTAFSNQIPSKVNILGNPFSKIDSISIKDMPLLIEQLQKLDFIACTIYFSGAGFYNVVTTSMSGNPAGLRRQRAHSLARHVTIGWQNLVMCLRTER